MALQGKKAELKAKDSVEAAPSPKGVEKSEPKAKGSDKTGSGTNTPDKALPELKGVQPESNDTGQIPAAGSKAGGPKGSVQNPGQTNSTGSASSEDKLTGSSSDGYGMYILLGLLLGIFGYLWAKGHLQAFRKYVMETREQLRKCTWPTRDELYQHTVVVLLSTLMMGVFTVLADQTAALLVWDLLLQVPTSVFGKLLG